MIPIVIISSSADLEEALAYLKQERDHLIGCRDWFLRRGDCMPTALEKKIRVTQTAITALEYCLTHPVTPH